ncbi:hypothetical protein L3X38_040963 [Prunus dulcis]|uniref:SWIM-type domain-containing protein n=1 Tax=Prunus dulcis TaxID=3755 RepID=A0AAD4URH2_PRUDU|nr:hypothetical protein L3X38_040963 [Prunus dulcis]
MVERIRTNLMLRVARQKDVKWTQRIGPKIFHIIEKNLKESDSCIAQNAGGNRFQVTHMLGGQYAVDVNTHSCSCRKWDLCGIPCCHGMTAISRQQRSPITYVNKSGRPKKARTRPVDEIPKGATKLRRYGIAIRGGLTRTATTVSQIAPTNVATQSSGNNAATQSDPCNLASQAGPSNVTQNTSRPQGKKFKSPVKRARPWR